MCDLSHHNQEWSKESCGDLWLGFETQEITTWAERAGFQEIKSAYRNMATKYHPDKVSHLGEDFAKFAEEKFKSVNDAYQQIKKERNI